MKLGGPASWGSPHWRCDPREPSRLQTSHSHTSLDAPSPQGESKMTKERPTSSFPSFMSGVPPLRLEHAKTQLLGLNDSCTHPATQHGTSLDSFSKVVMRLFNIVRTLAMGSALLLNLVAIENSTRLLNFTAWFCKYSAARRAGWASGNRRETNAVPWRKDRRPARIRAAHQAQRFPMSSASTPTSSAPFAHKNSQKKTSFVTRLPFIITS